VLDLDLGPVDAELVVVVVVVGFGAVVTDADGSVQAVLGFLDRIPR
jgi:hypothetical protein